MSIKVTIIAGARPNFIKIAPIIKAIEAKQNEGAAIEYRLIHTGQHYDRKMSGDFFVQLGIPEPDNNLGAGGGSQAEQTAAIMIGFEKELQAHPADLVLVVGDVTSTMACSITAKKLNTDVAHVEGGIRSGDWTMPEEVNRIVTDSISNWFFTTSEIAGKNLLNSGIDKSQIFFVGNTMIDTLLSNIDKLIKPDAWDKFDLKEKNYLVLTLHRPANVDQEHKLSQMIDKIMLHSNDIPVVFPVHPRTKKQLSGLENEYSNLHFTEPLSYLEFNYLVKNAKGVVTDSGGITEETTVLDVPCITLRDNTERPETIEVGTNELAGTNPDNIVPYLEKLMNGDWKKGGIPPFWDGKTSERIVGIIIDLYS